MGLRSSRINFVDVKDDPRNPRVTKVIEPDDYQKGTGYSRSAHCGPEGIYVTNIGAAFSDDGPKEAGSIRHGGIAGRAPHPSAPDTPLAGAPQIVEISRDGRRVYWTNSLYDAWDDQFYPNGVGAWMVKADVDTVHGGMRLDERFFPHGEEFRGNRVHQTHLEGGTPPVTPTASRDRLRAWR